MEFSVGITALGAYTPRKVLTNDELASMVDTSNEWIVERTGIHQRHIADPSEATSDLAYKAFLDLSVHHPVSPREIDLIVVATVTPDMIFPTTANLLQHKIGASNAGAMDLLAACAGFIYGLSTGAQFIKSGTHKKLLVFGADTMSRIVDWEDRTTCVIFGDGAGVVMLEPVDPEFGIRDVILRSDGEGASTLSMPAGGSRLPASLDTVRQHLHFIKMNGRETFAWAVRRMGEVLEELLQRNSLKPEDIGLVICHQANGRIIETTWKKFNLPPEKFFVNIHKYGNTTAASIPLALYEAYHEGRLKKGDWVVLDAFGAGFTYGGVLMKWWLNG